MEMVRRLRSRGVPTESRADGGREVATPSVENAEVDMWSCVDGIEAGKQRLSSRFDRADLAIVMACLDPDAVFVRQRGGGGTSVMRREADGAWYFVD